MVVEQYTTSAEHLGGPNWRIFVKRQDVKFSFVVQAGGQPSHEEITGFFNNHHKKFFIEV